MKNESSRRSPIITLLTDFGSQDYFVAAMKGVILSADPGVRIVDITHEVPPQDIHAAAFNLLAVYRDFPPDTIHVAVVDPGVGSERRGVLVECGGQFFVGPDNGVFSWVCEREGNCRVVHLANEGFFRHPVSTTFHGRDVFAPVAAALSTGVAPEDLGEVIHDWVHLESLAPKGIGPGAIEGRIIHVDHFGNCVTNLRHKELSPDFKDAKIVVNAHEIKSRRRFFAERAESPDDVFCIPGSAGFWELAVNNGSAARVLNATRGQRVSLITKGAD